MKDTVKKYIEYSNNETNLPVFHQPGWLDAVCGGRENWDVVLMENNGQLKACLPLYLPKPSMIMQPPLTPYLGPYIKFPEGQKEYSRLRYEHETLDYLVSNLPSFKFLKMNLLPGRTNWLPFYWKNYNQTTRYTYRLENLDKDTLYENMKGSLRRQINKADGAINVEEGTDLELFHKVNSYSFQKQNIKIPYSLDFLKRIDDAVIEQRKILFARDKSRNIHAAIYVVWDKNSAYYLMGGLNPAFGQSGAKPLLFWEAIQYVSKFVSVFDFEGSMIPSIEKFFSSFGAKQTPYFRIYKDNRNFADKAISKMKTWF
jgi:hypothetical protein